MDMRVYILISLTEVPGLTMEEFLMRWGVVVKPTMEMEELSTGEGGGGG